MPVSRRWTTRTRPSGSVITAATLTECLLEAVVAFVAGLVLSGGVGVLGCADPVDDLVWAAGVGDVEELAPVEELVPLDGVGRAVGEQGRPVDSIGAGGECAAGDGEAVGGGDPKAVGLVDELLAGQGRWCSR